VSANTYENLSSTLIGVNGSKITDTQSSLTNYNGIDNNTAVSLAYDSANMVVTMSANGASAYVAGVKYPLPTQTFNHVDVTDSYFLQVLSSGAVTFNTASWNLVDDAPIAAVYYNATTGKGILMDERHPASSGMSNATHLYEHTHEGTRVTSGFAISSYTVNSNVLVDVQPTVGTGVIADEDLYTTIPAVSANTSYNCWYRSGADVTGEWDWQDSNTPFINNTTNPFYNQLSGGNWTNTEISTINSWFNVWVCAVPTIDNKHKMVFIQGQVLHTSSATASAASFATAISWGAHVPFRELAPLYQIVCKRGTVAGTSFYTVIESVNRLIGTRSVLSGIVSATSHSALSNRTDANSHPATAIAPDTTNFSKRLSTADTTVQAALDTLDDSPMTRAFVLRDVNTTVTTSVDGYPAYKTGTTTQIRVPLINVWGSETVVAAMGNSCFGLKTDNAGVPAYGRIKIIVNGVSYYSGDISTNATDYVDLTPTVNISVNDIVNGNVTASTEVCIGTTGNTASIIPGKVCINIKYI